MSATTASAAIGPPPLAGALATIARMTWLEAVRSRWLAMLVIGLLLLLTLAGFIGEWAMVEKRQVVLSVLAPAARLLAVVMVMLLAVSSVAREFADRSIMLLMSAPVSRSAWVTGRLLGLALVCAMTAFVLTLPVMVFAAWSDALIWAASLWLELCVVAGSGLLVACAIRQVPAAMMAVLAFYLLSRVIGVLMLIAERAPYEASALASQATQLFLKVLGGLLPRYDLFTQTAWLLDGASLAVLAPVALQAPLYLAILWLVARIDFAGAEL